MGQALRAQPMAGAGTLPGTRRSGAGQQPGRERHPPDGPWEEELAVLRERRSRGAQCGDLHLVTYLKDVLERLPAATNQTVAQLTPLHWKKASLRPAPVKLAA